ncbi:hypothetical protein AC1031_009910 [Aphanomyces cochlioides]|nr:hypothetical protein AC1031_009910 [Aphanomyces cochlioides]
MANTRNRPLIFLVIMLEMAPEVLKDGHYSDLADLFSFGAIPSELDMDIQPYSGLIAPSRRRFTDLHLMQEMTAGQPSRKNVHCGFTISPRIVSQPSKAPHGDESSVASMADHCLGLDRPEGRAN